jgi:hypothetical protein
MYFSGSDPLSILQNNTPREDLCGMTPAEIHHLLYDGWTDRSPIRLQPGITDQTMDLVPFFRLTEELVRIIKRDQPVKLTSKGYLPVKIIRELYDHRFITFWYIDLRKAKVLREQDSAAINCAHSMVKTGGLVKNVKNKLYLTKKGEQLSQPVQRSRLFYEVLLTYTQKWSWGNLDEYDEAHGIQQLWGFSVHLLFQFGHTDQRVDFYSQKFLMAFPLILEQFSEESFSNPVHDFERCYCYRTFERFLNWWGFAKVGGKQTFLDWKHQSVSSTPLLREVFLFE